MSLQKVRISGEKGVTASTRIFLDDVEVKDAISYQLEHRVGKLPVLKLELLVGTIEVDGGAEVILSGGEGELINVTSLDSAKQRLLYVPPKMPEPTEGACQVRLHTTDDPPAHTPWGVEVSGREYRASSTYAGPPPGYFWGGSEEYNAQLWVYEQERARAIARVRTPVSHDVIGPRYPKGGKAGYFAFDPLPGGFMPPQVAMALDRYASKVSYWYWHVIGAYDFVRSWIAYYLIPCSRAHRMACKDQDSSHPRDDVQ